MANTNVLSLYQLSPWLHLGLLLQLAGRRTGILRIRQLLSTLVGILRLLVNSLVDQFAWRLLDRGPIRVNLAIHV